MMQEFKQTVGALGRTIFGTLNHLVSPDAAVASELTISCRHYFSQAELLAALESSKKGSLLYRFSEYKLGCNEASTLLAESLGEHIYNSLSNADIDSAVCFIVTPPVRHPHLISPIGNLGHKLSKLLNVPHVSPVNFNPEAAMVNYSNIPDKVAREALRQNQLAGLPRVSLDGYTVLLVDDVTNTSHTLGQLNRWLLLERGASAVYPFGLFRFELEQPEIESAINTLVMTHGGPEEVFDIVSKTENVLTRSAIRVIYSDQELLELCCRGFSSNKLLKLEFGGIALAQDESFDLRGLAHVSSALSSHFRRRADSSK